MATLRKARPQGRHRTEAPVAEEQAPPVAVAGSVGRYEIVRELASGGMATVYLARQLGPAGFERVVALKRIHPHLSRESAFVEMFLDEARIASRIVHPNVCTVLDFGQVEGSYFIAMEHLAGVSFERVREEIAGDAIDRRTLALALGLVVEACEGLHAAHELRDANGNRLEVVHRDVTPRNLFVTYDGSVKVVDFGIARAADRLHRTITGELKGTLAYMAPEQALERPIDRRADVWSLGVVAWELVAGRSLFKRKTSMSTLRAVIDDSIAPPSSVRSGVPAALDAVLLRALSRDPGGRYATARELGRALTGVLTAHGEALSRADIADWMGLAFERELGEQRVALAEASGPRGANVSETGTTQRRPGRSRVRIAAAVTALAMLGLLGVLVATGAIGGPTPAAPRSGRAPERHEVLARAPVTAPPTEAPSAEALTATSGSAERAAPPAPRRSSSATRERGRGQPAGAGTVEIATPGGWAYVLERGRKLGQTPMRASLAAGRHTLVLQPFGEPRSARRVSVTVTRAGTTRVSVRVGR